MKQELSKIQRACLALRFKRAQARLPLRPLKKIWLQRGDD